MTKIEQSGSVIKPFFTYLIPSLIGLLALTSANIIDGIVLGRVVGANALATISLLLPWFTFLFALALALAIGGAVNIGYFLGEKSTRKASEVFTVCLFAAVIINTLIALLSFIFEPQLYALLQVPNSLLPVIKAYFSVIRWVMILQLFTMVLYYFVRCDEQPRLATRALLAGAIINIVLDIVFVAWLDWGVAGAAWATAVAQVCQCLLLCRYFLISDRRLYFVRVAIWGHILRHCFTNGASEFINEVAAGLLFLVLNILLIRAGGEAGVAAFSIVNYFIFLSIMVYYGIADALHVLVSHSMGARNTQRARQFFVFAIKLAFSVGALLAIGFLWGGDIAAQGFVSLSDSTLLADARAIMLVIWPLFLVNGVNILVSCYLTALRKPAPSGLLSLTRGLLLPGSLLLVLYTYQVSFSADTPKLTDFLIALPIAEWLALLLALLLLYRYQPEPIIPN